MDEKKFHKLIKKDLYQVFLFSCPAPIPINIALHYWFVVNNKGKLSRWDVFTKPNQNKTSWSHLHKQTSHLSEGMEKLMFKYDERSKSTLRGQLSGGKESIAEKMVKFIEKSPEKYPYCKKYRAVPGPNSNSYIQWIINKFPKSKFKLFWRAIGKNYNRK